MAGPGAFPTDDDDRGVEDVDQIGYGDTKDTGSVW